MLATFAVGQVLWSMLWFFLFFLWIMLLFNIFGDLFRDTSASGVTKVLWCIFLIVLPYLGAFVYIIVRGNGMNERAVAQARADEAQMQDYIRAAAGSSSVAGELARLAELRDSGALSDDEFAAAKAKLIG